MQSVIGYRFVILATLIAFILSPPEGTAADETGSQNLVLEGIPEIPPEVARRFQQYQNARYAFLRGWHPSGEGILITTRFGETDQVHWVKSPGGARHQITSFDEPVSDMGVSPDPTLGGFVFDKDVGGAEFFQTPAASSGGSGPMTSKPATPIP